ncbi:MAG: hypothetical protein U9Q99_02535 [Nanoarchaeota archaeon]|nr:hypothetical protein [Nanoarchaeota archaeon]
MVKKKVTKKKVVKKKIPTKKRTSKKKSTRSSVYTKTLNKGAKKQNILKKGKFKTHKLFKSSLIGFILSLIIVWISQNEVIDAFFGLILIISGALIILSILLEIIFLVLKNKK